MTVDLRLSEFAKFDWFYSVIKQMILSPCQLNHENQELNKMDQKDKSIKETLIYYTFSLVLHH